MSTGTGERALISQGVSQGNDCLLVLAILQEKENVYPEESTTPPLRSGGGEARAGADQLETIESSPEMYTPEQDGQPPRRPGPPG